MFRPFHSCVDLGIEIFNACSIDFTFLNNCPTRSDSNDAAARNEPFDDDFLSQGGNWLLSFPNPTKILKHRLLDPVCMLHADASLYN